MKENALTKSNSSVPVSTEQGDELPVFVPRVDIIENEEKIILTAEMPGVDAEGVDVSLEGQVLTIVGKCLMKAPEGYSPTYEEYTSGSYERDFTLGDSIDRENIKAEVKDGLLSLTLPKAKEALPRRISVKAG